MGRLLPRRSGALALSALLLALGTGAGNLAARAETPPPLDEAAVVPAGMPPGVPAAARATPPTLPAPPAWPFGEDFPRTSGTSRVAAGALFATDFIHDDHGAAGMKVGRSIAGLAPARGTYTYPPGPAMMNGADVFRTAIGVDDSSTWWRVDWNTLVDPSLPIAAFAVDVDGDPSTGVERWPAGAGVRSPGSDAFLVVSGAGAWLHWASVPAPIDVSAIGGSHHVDSASRSFVVRLPLGLIRPVGESTVRLVAGLAAPGGRTFAPVPTERGALPGQPPVYNAAFRTYEDEPSRQSFWFEQTQAVQLALGDVTPFSATVDWGALASGAVEPEPQPTGWTNRWYVSSIELGQGVKTDAPNSGTGDVRPNFLGRVQPYGVFVPTSYRSGEPAPLTWVLHSLSVQHNQYSATAPKLLQQACEERGSICATTLGRAPDGWYVNEAELDFWEVWRDLADRFTLDPDGTVISGYSMGGYGTYRLGLSYPDVFAGLVALAAPPGCGLRFNRENGGSSDTSPDGVCAKDGDTTALLDNGRWSPIYVAHGTLDQLVPISGVLEHVGVMDELGLRHRFDHHPAEDHMAYSVKDGFSEAAAAMRGLRRELAPGHVSLVMYPHAARDGLGPTGAWWLRNPVGRDATPGRTARVDGLSPRLPTVPGEPVRSTLPLVPGDPSPGVRTELTWAPAAWVPGDVARVQLSNLASLDVDLGAAGYSAGEAVEVDVTTDGDTVLRFIGDGRTTRSYELPAGTYRLTIPAG